MRKTRDIYEDFCKHTEYKRSELMAEISNLNNTKEYLNSIVENNLDYLCSHGFKYSDFIANGISDYKIRHSKLDEKYKQTLLNYNKVIKQIKEKSIELSKLELLRIPYEAYSDILMEMNREIMKSVLNGYIFSFGSKTGRLFIKEIENIDYRTGDIKQRVDWGSSWKYHDQLIEEGKVPYNSKTAPDGVKWFIYFTDEFSYWFKLTSRFLKNRRYYRFIPTNYCHTHKRSQLLFSATVKSKDEIFNTHALGNRDKMHALLRFDKQHFLKYRREEIKLS